MPAIIAAIVGWLISALRQYLPGIVGRILLSLGIGFATKTLVLPSLLGIIQAQVSGLPATAVAYFQAFGLDVCVTIILSAAVAVQAQSFIIKRVGA